MTLAQGQYLNNRYTILELLGQGGFGAVYKAWDNTLNVPCAVKESFLLSPEGQRQFLHEAQILAGLRHPNLPRVTDFFTLPEQGLYLVMDFVEGQDLEQLRAQAGGRLPEAQVLAWIAQVCDALSYLHRQKPPVIHRDIKPANIRLAPPDEDYPLGRAMLVDFGIAKAFDPVMRTTIGARAVTPGFSPHEQYGQTASVTDPRTDLYSLGATLYALLTGQIPPESVLRLLRDPLVPPRALNPAISAQTETVILQALQNDPELRFQSATRLRAAITDALSTRGSQPPAVSQPVSPYSLTRLAVRGEAEAFSPPTPPPVELRMPQAARPFPWKRLGLSLALLAGLGLLALLASQALPAITDSPLTQTSQARANQTAEVVAALLAQQTRQSLPPSLTPSPSPISLSLTPTPSPIPPSLTPTHRPPTYTPHPTLGIGSTRISSIDGMVMSYIPAGTFLMGSESGDGNGYPVHSVTLDAFWMDQTEVTNAMFARCVAAGQCGRSEVSSNTRSNYYGNATYANYPVINMDRGHAIQYCNWAGRRWPTEAEWEYAARGGLVGARYPWGDEEPSCTLGAQNGANYKLCSFNDTIAVGSFAPNGYGLYDMAGNAWEWVSDYYAPYTSASVENPTGAIPNNILRRGSWYDHSMYLSVSYRFHFDWGDMGPQPWGFRCVDSP
jgi:formylglycine-generating enzyme required for sulfatase activity